MDNAFRQKIERLEAEIEALKSERIPTVDRASKRRDKRQVFAGFGLFAVAILIAGTMSASALTGTNTVDSGDIKDGTIINTDIKADAILGSRVRNDSLTGADINESTLAATCPAGLTRVSDVCYGALRPVADDWGTALLDCADENLRLPSTSEAVQISLDIDGNNAAFWTNDIYKTTDYFAFRASDAGVQEQAVNASIISYYLCMTTVGARP